MLSKEFKEQLVFYIVVVAGFVAALYMSGAKDKFGQMRKDFTSPYFLLLLVVVIVLSYFGLTHKDPDIKTTTHHSITAVIASYFSHLSLVFPAFFFVGIATYFSLKQFG